MKNTTSKILDMLKAKFYRKIHTDHTVKNQPNRFELMMETRRESDTVNVTIEVYETK